VYSFFFGSFQCFRYAIALRFLQLVKKCMALEKLCFENRIFKRGFCSAMRKSRCEMRFSQLCMPTTLHCRKSKINGLKFICFVYRFPLGYLVFLNIVYIPSLSSSSSSSPLLASPSAVDSLFDFAFRRLPVPTPEDEEALAAFPDCLVLTYLAGFGDSDLPPSDVGAWARRWWRSTLVPGFISARILINKHVFCKNILHQSLFLISLIFYYVRQHFLSSSIFQVSVLGISSGS
jgi:hypothetical protein